ncbi:HEPN domain-containing protein [Candidatus Bipolaricaulota bacterium]|nr:HEPN domain-containing protein [Candidatus Bipolaricaulota bacterium]
MKKNKDRKPPDDPEEWLNRAKSNLVRARQDHPDIYLEDLCFDAQQAAEKAIKAILIDLNVDYPYTHDLMTLLTRVSEAGRSVPDEVKEAAMLTDYAVESRYPSPAETVTDEEYKEAVDTAKRVVNWASKTLEEEG